MKPEVKELAELLDYITEHNEAFMEFMTYLFRKVDKDILGNEEGKMEWCSDIIYKGDRFKFGAMMFKMESKRLLNDMIKELKKEVEDGKKSKK